MSLAEKSSVFKVHYRGEAILSLFTIPVIVALLTLLRDGTTGIAAWSAGCGLLEAALLTVDIAYEGVEGPRVPKAFARAPQRTQETIIALGLPHIDPCFLAWEFMGGPLAELNIELSGVGWSRGSGRHGHPRGLLLVATFAGVGLRRPCLIDAAAGLGGLSSGPRGPSGWGLSSPLPHGARYELE